MKRLIEILITIFILSVLALLLVNIIPAKAATKSLVARRVDEIFENAAKREPNELSVIEIRCPCGLTYKVMGYDLCLSQGVYMVMDIEPNESSKPDITKLVGGFKKLAELIEYYHNPKGTKIYFKDK